MVVCCYRQKVRETLESRVLTPVRESVYFSIFFFKSAVGLKISWYPSRESSRCSTSRSVWYTSHWPCALTLTLKWSRSMSVWAWKSITKSNNLWINQRVWRLPFSGFWCHSVWWICVYDSEESAKLHGITVPEDDCFHSDRRQNLQYQNKMVRLTEQTSRSLIIFRLLTAVGVSINKPLD